MTMSAIEINDQLPPFEAFDPKGNKISQHDLEGFPTLLYFFPSVLSPVWIGILSQLKQNLSYFNDFDVRIIGVFPQEAEALRSFDAEHLVPFVMIADPNSALFEMFDIDVHDSHSHASLILDEDTTVRWIERPVQQQGHLDRLTRTLIQTQCF